MRARRYKRRAERRERGGDTNEYSVATVARPFAPRRQSHQVEDQSVGTGGAGQDRGGRRRGKNA